MIDRRILRMEVWCNKEWDCVFLFFTVDYENIFTDR